MELYYRDLISEDASLEKLVDDLLQVVQGADELAEAAGASLGARRDEVTSQLQRLKAAYQSIRESAMARARATDEVLHHHPYLFAAGAFAVGLLAGVVACRGLGGRADSDS